MKRRFVNKITVLLVFTLLLSAFTTLVFAEEAPGFELPVTVKVSGTPPTTDGEYKIILKADNPDYPMPEASIDGEYQLLMLADSKSKFPIIEFDTLGVYTYKIYQFKEDNKDVGYDARVYNLVVYVTNAEDNSGLETTTILYLIGETDKFTEVLFEPANDDWGILPGYEPDKEDDWGVLPGYVPDKDPTDVKTGVQTNVSYYVTIFGLGVITLTLLVKPKKDRIDNR